MNHNKLPIFGLPPFHIAKFGSWVYNANNEFIFEFEREWTNKGEHVEGQIEKETKFIELLNSKEKQPNDFFLTIENGIEILNHGKHFITIRGYGYLTGIGACNLTSIAADKIQDEFVLWILNKINHE